MGGGTSVLAQHARPGVPCNVTGLPTLVREAAASAGHGVGPPATAQSVARWNDAADSGADCGADAQAPTPVARMMARRNAASARAALVAAQAAHVAHGVADRAALWGAAPVQAELLGLAEEAAALLAAAREVAEASDDGALHLKCLQLRGWLLAQGRDALAFGRSLQAAQQLGETDEGQLESARQLLDRCCPGWEDAAHAKRVKAEDAQMGELGGAQFSAALDGRIQALLKKKAVAVRVGDFDRAAAAHVKLLAMGHASDSELATRERVAAKLGPGLVSTREFKLVPAVEQAANRGDDGTAEQAAVDTCRAMEEQLEIIALKLRGLLKHRSGDAI